MMVQDTLRDTLYKLGCDVSDGFTIDISSQGDKVRVYDEKLGYIPHHRVLAWCAASEMERGQDIALPFDAPHFLDDVAKENGVTLHRYFDCPADSSDAKARKIAAFQMWSRDALMQAIMFMSIVKREGGLENLCRRLPDFAMSVRTIDTDSNPAWLIRGINPHEAASVMEGVIINNSRGVVLVKPLKRGTGLRIMAEAASAEIADEICADVETQLKKAMDQKNYADLLEPR
jgi:mannose-1-phosphate guanylyltransferase/phosphomannomutase